MEISKKDFLTKHCIKVKDRVIYPYFKYESFDEETKSYTGLVIIKTAEEMREAENKIDICPTKTVEQRLEEAEQKLAESEEEKKLLKAQVEANASSYEFLESCVMEMAGKVYA